MNLAWEGRNEEALGLLEQAVTPLETAEYAEAAAANHNLAALFQEAGDLDGAVFHCFRALVLYDGAEDVGGIYACLQNLAIIHTSRGETGKAMETQHQAAQLRKVLREQGDELLRMAEEGWDRHGERLKVLGLAAARVPRDLIGMHKGTE